MEPTPCDIVIRYNPNQGTISLHAVASAQLEPLCHHAWTGFIRSVADLQAMPAETVEQLVGRHVLGALEQHSQVNLKIRDYEELARQELEHTIAALEARAQEGDAEAQFAAFRVLWNHALKCRSVPVLDRAESYLHAAAHQGHQAALTMHAIWPGQRGEAERIITAPLP